MYTSLYLNNNKILAAVGTKNKRGIRVKRMYETWAPEGSLVNGVVTDADAMTDCLRQFFKENRIPKNHVALVLNSSRVTLKTVRAPKMKPKQTLEYVKREFAAMQQKQDMIVGYFVEGKDEKGILDLFALRMDRDFLDVYESIFKRLGIHLEMVESGLGSFVAAADHFDYLKDKNCILQILGETNLYSVLFSKGRYVYSSSTRMFQEKGTTGFGMEVARTVSGMLQFAAAQKMEDPITHVYWGGFNEENEKLCREAVEQLGRSLKINPFPKDKWIRKDADAGEDYLGLSAFAVTGLGMPGADTDLYKNYRKNSKKALERKAFLKAAVPVFTVLGLGVAATAGTSVWYFSEKNHYDELVSYNESPAVLQMLEQYDELLWENQVLTGATAELSTAKANLKSYPEFDSRIRQLLLNNAAGLVAIEINGYNAATGAVQMSVTAGEMNDIHLFVERLERQEGFVGVDYSGYTQSSQSSLWTSSVVVYLEALQEEEVE